MTVTISKLGSIITDKFTNQIGMIIVYSIDTSGNTYYLFQPKSINPKTKVPVPTFWITPDRVLGARVEVVDLPTEVLSSYAEDKATGFGGTVTSLYYHLNGCIHLDIKPTGIIEETGETINTQEFDIRRLKGTMIKELTEEDLQKSKTTTPSPEYTPSLKFRN